MSHVGDHVGVDVEAVNEQVAGWWANRSGWAPWRPTEDGASQGWPKIRSL